MPGRRATQVDDLTAYSRDFRRYLALPLPTDPGALVYAQLAVEVSRGMEDLAGSVRQLHRPLWYRPGLHLPPEQVWLVCRGCDGGSHAEDPPGWPCRTAELVYAREEIAAREPQVPECPENHRTYGEGPPARAQAVFMRAADGTLTAQRWKCGHVAPVPVTSSDPWSLALRVPGP